jgi:hypothetical protein
MDYTLVDHIRTAISAITTDCALGAHCPYQAVVTYLKAECD